MSTTIEQHEGVASDEGAAPPITGSVTSPRPHQRRRDSRRRQSRKERRRTGTIPYLLIGIAVWALFGFFIVHLGDNGIARGVWVLLGAALAPAALVWAMAHRLTPTDMLSGSTLLRAMILGGFGAVMVGGTLDTVVALWSPSVDGGPGVLSLLTAGVVEEAAKAAFVIVVGWNVAKTVRNGLFLGGAVGAGFALYETLGYIAAAMIGPDDQVVNDPTRLQAMTAVSRSIMMPFMHPIWSALLAAAIFGAAAGRKHVRVTLGVIAAYLGVSALHGVWDGGGAVTVDLIRDPFLAELAVLPQHFILIAIEVPIWLYVVRKFGRAADRALPATDAPQPVTA